MKFVRANFDANPALAYWQPDGFYALKSGIAHEICKKPDLQIYMPNAAAEPIR